MATGVQLEVYNAKNKRVLSKTSTSMGYESMNVSKIWRINIVQDTTIQTEATIRHTMEDGVTIAICNAIYFRKDNKQEKGIKVVLKREQELNSIQFLYQRTQNLDLKVKQSRFLRRRATLSRSQKRKEKLKKEHIMFR